MYEAKVIADSICHGHRLTTMQVTHPRVVHAEFNTHCMFARNASSSRAIPFKKSLEKVMEDPFIPVHWGKNQSGMQAESELSLYEQEQAVVKWLEARDQAVQKAKELADPATLNVHKQIVNRLLEPWSWITVCVTGDAGAWSNYFSLRCHKDAQPDIAKQAYMAQLEYYKSTPRELCVGDWHLPYITPSDLVAIPKLQNLPEVSAGRCARTSYLTQEGKRDYEEDIRLYERLVCRTPLHASPLEHVCIAMGDSKKYAKYIGWKSLRHCLPNEYVVDFKPNHPELVKEK